MSDIAIKVENLSKLYRIGARQQRHDTLRDSIAAMFDAPKRWFSRNGRAAADDTIWALKDVSFEVKHGEVVGIIGRNGAGKSTLLKILSRITRPTTGSVEIHGRVGSLLEVGTGFHPELTGRENIYLNGAILGMKRAEIERKFDEIVAFAEIEKFLDTPVKRYSSGMYVRLAFAVAAHLEPEILIVDEVLAVGDMSFQKKCLGKMQEVAGEGRTVLFVSHNLSAITAMCSQAMLLTGGKIATAGATSQVVSLYVEQSSSLASKAEWGGNDITAGMDGVKNLSIEMLVGDGENPNIVSVAKPFKIRLKYYVAKPRLSFRCALSFHTRGTCAFTTLERTEVISEKRGWYCSEVEIPGNLLAEGDYTVGLSLFSSRGKKIHYCKVNDIVAFHVVDPLQGNSARGDYAEAFAGVVRPLLSWSRTRLGERATEQFPGGVE